MGEQIIKYPDRDRYAVLSSVTDTFVILDATREEIIEDRVAEAAERAREQAEEVFRKLDAGQPLYYQFAKTWEEACEINRENGGEEP
ncbi:hypothetical protein ACWF99_23755 [Nocardia sp. NPDC055002]